MVEAAKISEVWEQACVFLLDRLREDAFSRWIKIIEPVSIEEDEIVLSVDNDFYQTWLEDNYLPLIRDALASVLGTSPKIRFVIGTAILSQPDKTPTEVPDKPREHKSLRERIRPKRKQDLPTNLNPRFTMNSFIVGSSNNFAQAASLAVSQAPGRAYNPLFIYGGVGLGKTHLMHAIGNTVKRDSKATVFYVSSETMLNEYIDALGARSLPEYRRKYRNADVLLVDDIHFLAGKERIQEEFFHTFNTLFDSHKQIVMTSDRPASEIKGLEKRLVSRFEWGLVTELESPDLETRIAILRNKQQEMNVKLDEELIMFIAQNIRSNVRRLEGALVRTASYTSLMSHPLTVVDLQRLLKDTIEVEERVEVNCSTIQRAVAEHFDIRLADMTSSRRPRSIAAPRQIAMYLCRRLTSSSLPDIAEAFARTHATVLHAYRAVESRMEVDKQIKSDVCDIARKLGSPIL